MEDRDDTGHGSLAMKAVMESDVRSIKSSPVGIDEESGWEDILLLWNQPMPDFL